MKPIPVAGKARRPVRSAVTIGLLLVLFAAPILMLAIMAVSSRWQFPSPLPESLSVRAMRYLLYESPGFIPALLSSVSYSLASACLALVLSVLPARVLAREQFAAKAIVEALLFSPILLPVMTFSMGIHLMFLRMGLSGSWFGIVLVLTLYNYPYMLRALISGYLRVPREMTLTAKNLGASFAIILLRVELPSLLPAVAAGFPIVFLSAFSEYFLVFLIGGGSVSSLTGYLYPFIRGSDYPVSSLLVLIFLLVPLLLFGVQDWILRRVYAKRKTV